MKIGSLFSGYGGLDLAAETHFNAEAVWHAEWENAPSKVLAHHWPGVPNLKDVTTVNWHYVEPVDIITGGFPCQDVSSAGKRAGMVEGTRSNLWGAMRTAVEAIRPRYVIAENVRGLLSAKAQSDSDLELSQGYMGNRSGVNLRALGRVLGDLADLGYDAQWYGLRAADVGAPHGRFRVFIFAWDARQASPNTGRLRGDSGRLTTPGQAESRRAFNQLSRRGRTQVTANPVDRRLFGRPIGTQKEHPRPENAWLRDTRRTRRIEHPNTETAWGAYEPAIRRWEQFTGRAAPAATEPTGKNGRQQLSARFTEWIMGLPEGWVTQVPDVSRADQIKMCGNGVVPQQALAALEHMTPLVEGQHANANA